ncbi:outer membrane protein [Helicobacter cetorum]|uniref:outer membrane protein n=1 Tax=Helicobacter cetorum TaxID=138563 RepID=UPI000CF16C07|nr:outer membrane protein [Helicobacter cetorum]
MKPMPFNTKYLLQSTASTLAIIFSLNTLQAQDSLNSSNLPTTPQTQSLNTESNINNNAPNPSTPTNEIPSQANTPSSTQALATPPISPTKAHQLADKSAWYAGIGFQLGGVSSTKDNLPIATKQGAPYNVHVSTGWGIQAGYKARESKLNAFRYGIFYDFTSSLYNTYAKNSFLFLSTYGVYGDWIPNVVNNERFFFGFRMGVAIAGSSYGMQMKHFDVPKHVCYGSSGSMLAQCTYTTFQFLVNLGVRMGGKHNQFELGVKIPTVTQYGDVAQDFRRRIFAVYWDYIYSF